MGGTTKIPRSTGRRPTETDDDDGCPRKLKAVVSGPVAGVQAGTWLEVILQPGRNPAPVVLVDVASGAVMGSLMGIPKLAELRECLTNGVRYRAHVEAVSGGRVDVTVIRH